MPRYFFDIHDGYVVIDNIGQELVGIGAAKSEAMRVASGFASDPRMVSGDGGAINVIVRDGPGSEVCTIRLAFTINGLNRS